MSSGGQTTSQTSGPPDWLAQYGPDIAGAIGGAINQPYNPYPGMQVAPLSGLQNAGLQGLQYGMFGNPSTWAANDYLGNTISGGSVNPFMDQVANKVKGQVTDAYNNATSGTKQVFNAPGSWGSSAAGQAQGVNDLNLSRGLTEGMAPIYQQGFENDQNRRMQAVGLSNLLQNSFIGNIGQAMGLGDVQRQYGQQLINADTGNWNAANDYPWTQLQRGASIAGPLKGGAGQQTTMRGPGPDRVAQGLGTYALGNAVSNKGGKT